jgi:hypothetical protein
VKLPWIDLHDGAVSPVDLRCSGHQPVSAFIISQVVSEQRGDESQ